MPLVIEKDSTSESKENKSPHLAITHNEYQGGAANGRNVSLLLKSDVALDEETKNILKSLLGDESFQVNIEKQSVNGKRDLLSEAVKEKFGVKDNYGYYYWAYVEDFDENTVVFSNSDGVSYTSYSIDNDVVTLGEPQSANRIISYTSDSGSVVLSESDTIQKSGMSDDIPVNVRNLIAKSFENISKNEKLQDVFKSKHEKGKLMDELQKSVDVLKSKVTELETQLEKANQERDAAKSALEAIEKAQKEAKQIERKAKLAEVVAEEKVEELQKSLEALDDAGFETVLKSLAAAKEVTEESDLFKRKGGNGKEVDKDVRKSFREEFAAQFKQKQ